MNRLIGTSFADPADLRAYNRSVWNGATPREALNYGDNGLGAWQLSTCADTGPCVALPADIVLSGTGSRNRQPRRLVRVFFEDKFVDCQVRDLSPHGIIDLNPDACKALGLKVPLKTSLNWDWL
jgi:hypothetical protein